MGKRSVVWGNGIRWSSQVEANWHEWLTNVHKMGKMVGNQGMKKWLKGDAFAWEI